MSTDDNLQANPDPLYETLTRRELYARLNDYKRELAGAKGKMLELEHTLDVRQAMIVTAFNDNETIRRKLIKCGGRQEVLTKELEEEKIKSKKRGEEINAIHDKLEETKDQLAGETALCKARLKEMRQLRQRLNKKAELLANRDRENAQLKAQLEESKEAKYFYTESALGALCAEQSREINSLKQLRDGLEKKLHTATSLVEEKDASLLEERHSTAYGHLLAAKRRVALRQIADLAAKAMIVKCE